MNSYIGNVLNEIHELTQTNSIREKEAILVRNSKSEDFKNILKWLLDGMIVTGISSKKLDKNVEPYEFNTDINFYDMMDYLKIHNTGTDDNVAFCKGVLNMYENEGFTENQLRVIRTIITKDEATGISVKTFNKIFKDSKIPVFGVMLAAKYQDNLDYVDGKLFMITKKLDGNRMVAIKSNGNVRFFTRNGKEYVGLNQIADEIMKIDKDNVVFDGEILATNEENLQSKDLFRKTMKLCRTKSENKEGLEFHIFDMLTLDEFNIGTSCSGAMIRKTMLKTLIEDKYKYLKYVKPLYVGYDTSEIYKHLVNETFNGEEGVMINIASGKYSTSRTKDLLKVKEMKEGDVLVVGIEKGTGRNSDVLGKIIVEYLIDGQVHTSRIGSGFTDFQRSDYIKNPGKIIGKVATIQYFEITQSETGNKGIRFGVWLDIIRDDKDCIEDTNIE